MVKGCELLEVEKRLVGERMPCKCRLEVEAVEFGLFLGCDTGLDSRSILLSMIGSMAVICGLSFELSFVYFEAFIAEFELFSGNFVGCVVVV